MARTCTLAQLRTRSLQRADHENDNFIPPAEANDMVNQSLTALYDLLVRSSKDYYVSPTPFTITILTSVDSYALPTDFYKLRGVDLQLTGGGGANWVTVRPFNFNERNRYNYQPVPWNTLGVSQVRYHLTGSLIKFIPFPTNQAGIIRVWYIPACPLLVADSDTYDGVNGWDEWVVADVARKIKVKEETDTTALDQTLATLTQRVTAMSVTRDMDRPARSVDVNADGEWNWDGDREYN
jgi:hypothetical protein